MKFKIKHEIRGRIRIHMEQKRMTHEQADILLFYLQNIDGVFRADVYDRTADATIHYKGNRETIIEGLRRFRYEEVEVPNGLLETSGRAMNAEYQEKLVDKILFHYGRKFLLPYPISAAYTTIMSAKYIWKGIKTLMERKLEVPVLDATAIGVSILRSDFDTAGSVMFLLGIGELLEEWTHKKSVDDLARTMSLNVGKVWLKTEDQAVLVPSSKIKAGDQVVVHMGNVIPFVNIPSVVTDDYKGGKLAAEHLIARGHTSFVCLMNREEYSGCMRYAGFIDGINCAGLSPSSCTVFWFTHKNKDSIFLDPENQKLLELARNTSSFFCFNDASAVNLYRLLTASGFRIPDNISIIGYDDSYLCETLPVQLTSLHQDPHLTGYTAAKNLLQLIKDPNYNCNRTFDPYLVVRDSVK